MPDLEKVIKGLELCLGSIDSAGCPEGCPYYEACQKYENYAVFQPLMRDALETLKAQEWISVKDKLPEQYETVLVAVFGHDVIVQQEGETLVDAIRRTRRTVRYVTTGSVDEDGDWNGPDGFPMIVRPAYWMSLPEPPKEEGT